jgi:hypothetical protein
MPIQVSINVALIDKNKFFQGKKGKYLDLILIETPNGKYGNDYLVKQGQTREERASGVKTAIIGNAKILESKKGSKQNQQQQEESEEW